VVSDLLSAFADVFCESVHFHACIDLSYGAVAQEIHLSCRYLRRKLVQDYRNWVDTAAAIAAPDQQAPETPIDRGTLKMP
jgi:hypothetical protein